MAIFTAEDLGDALNSENNTIEIEGDLANKVYRIKITGAVAWAIAFGAIGIAVYSVIASPATGGTSLGVAALSATGAVSVLGTSVTTAAISIAVAARGAGSLNTLRKYKIVERSENRIVLKRE